MNECKHSRIVGDNYGSSCANCGQQLSGYGYGGFFGRNLNGKESCIHLWSPIGEGGAAVCVYCEEWKEDDVQS